MNWNWRAVRAIMRKDLKQVVQNKMVWLPIIIVPAMLLVMLPLVLVLLPGLAGTDEFEDLAAFLDQMPPQLKARFSGLSGQQLWIELSTNYLFAPLFLIVPLMVSSVLAADGFVGEKERKTLEGLLHTPIRDSELFVAKLLTALVPALVVEVASFFLYGLVVNLSGYRVMGRVFFPSSNWWALVFWLGPGVSVVGLGVTVLISSKAKTFVQTQQISGMLVLPIVFLMIGQISGLFFLGVAVMLITGLFIWLVGIWLVWIGAKTFSRGELITRV